MKKLSGIPASPGLASGLIHQIIQERVQVYRKSIDEPGKEMDRLDEAISCAREDLERIRSKTLLEAGEAEAEIFDAQSLMLEDPSLLENVKNLTEKELVNAEYAWDQSIEHFASQLEALQTEYFKVRAIDVRDVGKRVLKHLQGVEDENVYELAQPSVIIARDLSPSDTIRLNKELVLAFCTALGGPTSHTAILSKALGIPAIVGLGEQLLKLSDGDLALIDGASGDLWVDPDENILKDFKLRQERAFQIAQAEQLTALEPAFTLDNHQVEVVANIGNVEDAKSALNFGAEGVGLFRTEFLYLDRDTPPSEEEQVHTYKEIFDVMGEKPVVVRTLDVGGDKEIPYIDLGREENPFLGWRAIRICLDCPDLFKTQLRALLRSSIGHNLRLMFPMIATYGEILRAKVLLTEAHQEVLDAGHKISNDIQVGIMIEIPSAALQADYLARAVDFFSIGTNDLTQYTLAVDRTNSRVASLASPFHPAVLRLIFTTINAAHRAGKWVGLCGEFAGDPLATPLLIGMGLDEFSLAPPGIPKIKDTIRRLRRDDCLHLVDQVLSLGDTSEVINYLSERNGEYATSSQSR